MTAQPDPDVLPQGTRMGRTALRVNDLEEMTGFYRDVVGLSLLRHTDTGSVLGVGDTPLLVLEADSDAPERRRSSVGLFHNAFRVPSRAALGDALGRIREQWRLDGASDHGVSQALYLSDPEDNGVEVYRDFPREEWSFAADGTVRMGTDPLDLEPIAAAGTEDQKAPVGTDVGHIHLEVSSLGAFRDLYVDVVGFEGQTELSGALFVSAGGYHHHVGANTWNRRSGPLEGRGLSWFEILLPEPEAIDALRERIADSRYTPTETEGGISVTGPDGIEMRFRVEP